MKTAAAALIGAATLAMAAPAAQAQPQTQAKAADSADLQCLAVSFLALAAAKEDNARTVGTIAALYYLGKIDGKSPGANLDEPFVAIIKALKPEDVQKYSERCGAELQNRSKSIAELGDRLQKVADAEGAAAPAPPSK